MQKSMHLFSPQKNYPSGSNAAMVPLLSPPMIMNQQHQATQQRSAFFIVTVLGAVAWLGAVAPAGAQLQRAPSQVSVESRFVEANDTHRRGLGLSLFRTGEVQLNVYGFGGTGHGERIVTDSKTVTRTETVTQTQPMLVDIPGIPGLVQRDVTTKRDVKTKETVKHKRNAAPIQGGFGGAGLAAKYFVTPNIGLGLEGDWLEGESSIGTIKGTVTARFPMGSNAPYVFAGAGVQFGDGTMAIGTLGGGVEHRFTPRCGVFTDAAWMFGNHENAVVFRLGVTMTFGPCCDGCGTETFSGGARTDSWRQINPLVKEVRP